MVGLQHPHFLWLLLLALAMGLFTYRHRAGLPTRKKILIAVTRSLMLAAIVLALARPFTEVLSSRTTHVLVVDVSERVTDSELKAVLEACSTQARSFPAWDAVKVLAVGSSVQELSLASLDADSTGPGLRVARPKPLHPDGSAGGTAMADALQLAGALIHPGDQGDVRVFTTGWQIRGDATAAAWKLGERGIALATTPMRPAANEPWIISSVDLPEAAGPGQAVNVELRLIGRESTTVDASIVDGDEVLARRSRIQLDASSELRASIPITLRQPGTRQLHVRVTSSDPAIDGGASSDTRSIWVAPPRRVIVIDDSAQAAADLQILLGDAARVAQVSSADAKAGRIGDADLIVIGDVPADAIGDAACDSLRQRVTEGAGLFFMGGTSSLASGGWNESRLADVLPVRMPQELRETDPSVAVVFIIDTSGSMGTTKLELAKEVVRLALRGLQPQDKVGIVEFYGAKRWAAPLQTAANKLELNRALNRLTSGGGTEIYPAVEEASYALRNVTTRLRHVVVLTDGGVESAPFERLIRRMAEANQTLSTMTIGPDASPLMESMAQWGNGRFYRVLDRMALPELLLHRPSKQTPSPIVEVPTPLVADRFSDVTAGLDFSQAPPLQGYVRAVARPGADVLLKTVTGDPVLARWRVGRGRVATLSTNLGSVWTASLGDSRLTGQLISNVCRSLYTTPPDGTLAIDAIIRPAGLELRLALVAAAAENSTKPVTIVLRENDRIVRLLTIDPEVPGSWNALFPLMRSGQYEISARIVDADVHGRGAITIPPAESAIGYAPNSELLEQMESANRASLAQSVKDTPAPRFVEWTGPLILVSMLMLLINIFLRRRVGGDLPPLKMRAPRTVRTSQVVALIASCLMLERSARAADGSSPPSPLAAEAVDAIVDRLGTTTRPSAATADDLSAVAQEKWAGGDLSAVCELLQRALTLEADPSRRRAIRLRLAVVLVESGRKEEAAQVLSTQSPHDPSAALLWAIYGQQDLAAAQLPAVADDAQTPFVAALRGSLLLAAGEAKAAKSAFKVAMPLAATARDKTFIADRMIASARVSGELDQLVDAWLSDASAAPERRLLLASILRADKRVDDLLRLWRELPAEVVRRDEPAAQKLLAEVIGAAEEAGRSSDAEAVCRDLWDRDPSNTTRVAALTGVLIRADRATDADAVFMRSAEKAIDGAGALSIAKLAFAAGRDDTAFAIADGAGRFPVADQIDALILQAQLARHEGDQASAAVRLERARVLAGPSGELQRKVGDASEEAGDLRAAIRAYESIENPDEHSLQRLAWLLRETGELARSQQIWQDLARSATSDARRTEARGRMLDLASRTGSIGDIAAELEQRLAEHQANAEDVNTLVDIYTGIRDTVSASEVLRRSAALLGGETEVLRRLIQLYMQGEQFGLADRALRQLLAADQESAAQTLQQIAVLAIERDRPDDALGALQSLAELSAADASGAELNAGIFDQLGMHEEAAAQYLKALNQNPGRAETWLLWANAMKGAKKQEEAIQRLLSLAIHAENDELFSVAVDGLLNLEAPHPALRIARMCAIVRLCENPGVLIRYDLARELSEAVGDNDASMRIGELYLLVASEQRTDVLRELITLASAAGRVDKVIDYQQTLIALGDQVPPQVFLDIGRRCLADGRLLEARRAFRRAQEVSDEEGTRLQISQLYERAGELKLAVQTLEPLVRRQENDVEARYRLALLHEQRGDFDAAMDAYLACVQRLVKQGGIAAGLVPARSFDEGVSKSIGDAERYLDAMLRGLVSVARTTEAQQRLAQFLERMGNETLARAQPARSVEPALSDVAQLVRRVSYAIHRPDIAEKLDESIIAVFPDDSAFLAKAIGSLQHVGLNTRANTMATRHSAAFSTTATRPAAQTPDETAIQIARRLIADDAAGAAQLLEMVPEGRAASPQTFPILITAAAALNDADAVSRWSHRWFSIAVKARSGEPDASELERCVRVSWPALNASQRRLLAGELSDLMSSAPVSTRQRLAMLVAQVNLATVGAAPVELAVASQAVADRNLRADDLATVLAAVGEPDRARVLEIALGQLPPERRTELLIQFGSRHALELNAPSLESIAAMASMKPATSFQGVSSEMGRDAVNPQLWKVLSKAFSRDANAAPSPEGLMWAARAAALAGDIKQGDRLAEEALKLLQASGTLDVGKWSDAVQSLSAAASRALYDSLNARTDLSVAELVLGGVLAEHLGEPQSAFSKFRSAFSLAPREASLRQNLIASARENLAWQQLLDALEPFVNDSSVVDNVVKGAITGARREMEMGVAPTVFALYASRKQVFEDPTKAEMYRFRAFQLLMRENRQWTVYPASAPRRAGGLLEYDHTVAGRQSIYQALAREPWAAEEYLAVFRATPPGAAEVEGIALGIASLPEVEITHVVEALDKAEQDDALTANDRTLLLALVSAGHEIGLNLAKALDVSIDQVPVDDFKRLAAIRLARKNVPHPTSSADRYIAAAMMILRNSGDANAFPPPIDTRYLSKPFLEWDQDLFLAPAPGARIDDLIESSRLRALCDADPKRAADAVADDLRRALIPVSSFPRSVLVAARVALETGDENAFVSRVQSVLASTRGRSYQRVPDLALAMPSGDKQAASAALTKLLGVIDRRVIENPQERPDLIRALALLGRWFEKEEDPQGARDCLEKARSLSSQPGEHDLWVLDLATELEMHADARLIWDRLNAAGGLPASRRTATSLHSE